MDWYYILLIILLAIILIVLLSSYICFRITFYVNRKKDSYKEFDIPPGDIYEPYRETMINWMKEAKKLNHQDIYIKSFDGLKLHAKYYEKSKGNIIEIMIHGYRGNAERDLCGGIQRAFELNHNVLLIDQRTSSKSEGNVISFGVNERLDCQSWVNYLVENFDNPRIILCGISMGAATVLMASSLNLPKNVIGVLADCGYSSQKDIIMKCAKDIHVPPRLAYPFIKLGAKIFGKFNLDEITPIESFKKSNIPTIFFHGNTDDFVPCYMSEMMFESKKENNKLVIIPNAGHGLCYLKDSKLYIDSLNEFFSN